MFKYFAIFILLLIFVPAFRRFIFFLLVGRSMVNEQKKANEQNRQEQRKEGEIRVDVKPSTKSKFDGGQYIDYEEVK